MPPMLPALVSAPLRRTRRSRPFAGLLVAIFLGSISSLASAAPPRDAAAAEALFERGRSAIARQDWVAGEKAFRESQSLDPAPGTLLNLGECQSHLGEVAAAWTDYTTALRDLAADDPRREYARGRAAELEKKLALLVVSVRRDAPPGTRVRRAGTEIPTAMLGSAIPVDAGRVTLVVSAPGRGDAELSVEARVGETARVEVAPGAPQGEPLHLGSTRTAGFVVGGVGAAGIVIGAVTGGLALSRASTYRSDCPSQVCPNRGSLTNAEAASSAAKSLSYASTAGFIVGAAGLGLGTYLVLRSPSVSTSTTGSLRVDWTVSPILGGAVTGMRGSF